MLDDLDELEKATRKALAAEVVRRQTEAKERKAKANVRKIKRKQAIRRATILGETIRDATLSPAERAAIASILLRRVDRPEDWAVIAPWLPEPSGAEFIRAKDVFKAAE